MVNNGSGLIPKMSVQGAHLIINNLVASSPLCGIVWPV